jgi:hypothetical protein
MWFVGSFDPVLELVIFRRQKLGDLIISGSYDPPLSCAHRVR